MATMLGYNQSAIVRGLEQFDKSPAALSGQKKFGTEDNIRKALDDFSKSQPLSFREGGIDKLPDRWRR
nr:unnamed protein product [Haemonchus contortus]